VIKATSSTAAEWQEDLAGGGGTHDLGGANHIADTLANLNSKISDATLIDTADSRLSDARDADALVTSSGTITITSNTPVQGQVLKAVSDTAALWQDDARGAYSLTFREGATVTGTGVYSSWASLYSALETFRNESGDSSRFEIIFDDVDTSPLTIPAGTYDMYNVAWQGLLHPGFDQGKSEVDISEGVVLTNLVEIRQLDITNKATSTPVVTLSNGDLIIITESADISSESPNSAPFFTASGLSASDFFTISLSNNSSFGTRGTYSEIVDLGSAAIFSQFAIDGSSSILKNTISGSGSADLGYRLSPGSAIAPQARFSGTINRQYGPHNSPRYMYDPAPGASPRTGAATLQPRDGFVRADVSGGAFALTLPSLPHATNDNFGQPIKIQETSGTAGLTVKPSAGNTINGSSDAVSVPPKGSLSFISDGLSEWHVYSRADLSAEAYTLGTTGAAVTVSGSAPPTTGQVLKATGSTTATWQDEAGGGGGAADALSTAGADVQFQAPLRLLLAKLCLRTQQQTPLGKNCLQPQLSLRQAVTLQFQAPLRLPQAKYLKPPARRLPLGKTKPEARPPSRYFLATSLMQAILTLKLQTPQRMAHWMGC
jgi:hypothetical protein